jgi:hypothetical protein
MILAFLRAEADASRWGKTVEAGLAATGFTRAELIDKADLSHPRQNQARLWILQQYRGYRQNRHLFRDFPSDVTWQRLRLEPHELDRLKYAKEDSWKQMSDETRKPSRLVEKLNRGELPQEVDERIRAIQQAFANGKTYPELIVAEGQNSELILIEGHSRASAYVASRVDKNIEIISGYSLSMSGWHYY